jgi:hypothetical protein
MIVLMACGSGSPDFADLTAARRSHPRTVDLPRRDHARALIALVLSLDRKPADDDPGDALLL